MKVHHLLILIAISSQFLCNTRTNSFLKTALSSRISTMQSVSLAFVGDILFHERVYKQARIGKDTYDFRSMLDVAKPYILPVDFAVANSESAIGGVELGLMGKHLQFNSPYEVGEVIKYLGFDFVTMANNHIADAGKEGILNALKNWEKLGIPKTGAYSSKADQENIPVVEVKGVKFAMLGYTTWTNHDVPEDYLTNHLTNETFPLLEKEIQRAKKLADVVVVNIHTGKEYARLPTDRHRGTFDRIAEYGPDIIIGHHPHVLEPTKWLVNSQGKKIFAAYSLGNFFSGQNGLYPQIGGILRFDVQKEADDKGKSTFTVVNPSFKLTYVDHEKYKSNYKQYLLKNRPELKEVYEEMKTHMSQWMPELIVD